VPNSPIYVWINGGYDVTRWLSMSRRGNGTCVIHLTDSCSAGKVSRLTSVTLPVDYLKTAVTCGAFQITLSTGYLLIRRSGTTVHLEFKNFEDAGSTKADFAYDDFAKKIAEIEQTVDSFAYSV